MTRESERPVHPGAFIKAHVIPPGMSVTDAAKRLGVSRPALSNLLNGRSSLSPRMAVRLEKTFGFDRQRLLEIQAADEQHALHEEGRSIAVPAFVPDFLPGKVKAKHIEAWSENIDSRHTLAILLRKLVHSTGHDLRRVDFPGYENAQRPGWDGYVEAGSATPWIPQGNSGWEFGVNQDPRSKAESDYVNRSNSPSISPAKRLECTFIFVTPRNWPGKTEWVKGKNKAGVWKEVRAYDASDLEQWLEGSVCAQLWLAEELNPVPVNGLETVVKFWQRWSTASNPTIDPVIFEPAIIAYRTKFKDWLQEQSGRPFVVAADSKGEAIAFLARLFQDSDLDPKLRDLAAVFESAQTLRLLAASASPFVPIVRSEETEQELTATVYRRLNCIVVRSRNDIINVQPDITLDLLNSESFTRALTAMGIEGDEADRLEKESGRSPTILRRRLSQTGAIKTPQWAGDANIARDLIPMALVGAWKTNSDADREVVSRLAGRSYDDIEQRITSLLRFDDSPTWSTGEYRGVASKMDALFAIAWQVTEKDLRDFLSLAEYVLSEIDPALDLPEGDRWAAELYNKVRDHSAALRDGVCETLVILSVHGNNLFQRRFGLNIEAEVSSLIQSLLTPLTSDKLLSHSRDLPRYAEAAPDTFLQVLEDDLKKSEPVVLGLLKPANSLFGGCPRTGLLWALECLAWKNLEHVTSILARLSKTKIDDNRVNKPIRSLGAIYRSWMPQTAAPLPERLQALEMLARRFPDIGWQICMACMGELNPGPHFGDYSYRPRLRSDASGAGQPVTRRQESIDFIRRACELALAWPEHNQKTLMDLVERVRVMPETCQMRVWDLIDKWADSKTREHAKAELANQIRLFAFTQSGQARRLNDNTKERARHAYAKLQAKDTVIRHVWLFASYWVEIPGNGAEEEELNITKQEEVTREHRAAAMKEIWKERSFEGVKALVSAGGIPHIVGSVVRLIITSVKAQVDFLRACLAVTGDLGAKFNDCIRGFLQSLDAKRCDKVLSTVAKGLDTEGRVRLFRWSPFRHSTWRLLDNHDEKTRELYWREVVPYRNFHSNADLTELIDRLLQVRRPRAAFHTVQLDWPRVETSILKRLLIDAATVYDEPADLYQLEAYYISNALTELESRTGVSPDDMAQLEFGYAGALLYSEYGFPNLGRRIAESPVIFVQLLALLYKRSDGGEDPPEWHIQNPEQPSRTAATVLQLLDQINRLPGTRADGQLQKDALVNWVMDVRRLCAEHGRAEIGDERIGRLLSKAPAEDDGTWPCRPVCEVLQRVGTPEIGTGFGVGVYNQRGAHFREEGGGQERELAAHYRERSEQYAVEYPFVKTVLENIAQSYDHDAQWHDEDANIRRRLVY